VTLHGDTIAAIATAPGRGGVAVVRVSGPDAFKIAETLTGKLPVPGHIAVRKIFGVRNEELHFLIDEGIVLAFKGPCSYTGEDVVEFQCHGGMVTPRRVLEACFAAGARLAERGEFTSRAFLTGRIGLDAAESVIELVDAKTDRAADAALACLDGERAKRNRALYEAALDVSTTLEHTLDVDESDLPPSLVPSLLSKVLVLKSEIADTISKLREGKILREGARVVLAGAPNAGKSSLLNALLGENRAIVSATPGTTRDSIEEWLDIEGWPVRLTDTAGLRGTRDAIEAEGVARANDLIAKADLVIALDCDLPGALHVHAKCDLDGEGIRNEELGMRNEGRLGSHVGEGFHLRHGEAGMPRLREDDKSAIRNSSFVIHNSLRVSAKTGEGLVELRHAIAVALEAKAQKVDEPVDDGEREAALLTEALAALRDFTNPQFLTPNSSFQTPPADIVLLANAVRSCSEALGRLAGAVYSDDLLDSIFSRFCVGK